jgi:hypothetical protein
MRTVSPRIGSVVVAPLLIALSQLPFPALAATNAGPYLLHLERGDSMRVVRIEPATFGMFRYVRADSVEGYVSGHKVLALTDADDRDVTRDVLERRRAIGVDPLLYRRDGSTELRRRHVPRREDRTFPIFEMGYYGQVSGPTSPYDDNVMVSTELGAMQNLSRSLAVGGVLHFETDDDRVGFGVGLRGRRWLSNAFSLDGGAGWMFAGEDDRGEFKAHAFFGEAAINFSDHLQLAASIESWRFARREYLYWNSAAVGFPASGSQPYNGVIKFPARRETLVHVGAKVGRYPGILLVVAVLFVTLGTQAHALQ